jgi:hypothetical protein
MTSRVSSYSWLLRDLPQTFVLLILAAFVVAILTYFIDWSMVRRESAVRPQLNNDNNEQRYTGSIIVPTSGDLCWEFMLDNRTGKMRDNGYVKCDEAAHQSAEKNPREGMDMTRLRQVGNAFRHKPTDFGADSYTRGQ